MKQTTNGFVDAIANYLSGVSSLGLTIGTNLFAENYIENTDVVNNHFVLFNEGSEQLLEYRHIHLNWTLKVVTARKKRLDAVSALHPIYDHLLNTKRFVATSNANESFTVLQTRSVDTPDITDQLDNGLFSAACSIQFELIPD